MRRWLAALALLLAPGLAWGEGVVPAGGTGIAVPGLEGTTCNDECLAFIMQRKTAVLDYLPKVYFSADGGQTGSYTAVATASNGNEITVTTATAHGMQVGDLVDLTNSTGTDYTGRWRITAVGSTTTFTVTGPVVFTATATGNWTHVTGGRCPGDLVQGNDTTGHGTKENPYRSFGRALSLAQRGAVNIVLDACDRWETNDGGGTGDNESASYTLDNSGVLVNRFSMNASVSHWAVCTGPHKVCVAITSSDPSGVWRPKVDPSMLDAGFNNAFYSLDDDGTETSRNGWLHLENTDYGDDSNPFPLPSDCTLGTDFYRTGASGQVSMLNLKVYMCAEGNGSAPNNEVVTSHNSNTGAYTHDLAVLVNVDGTYTNVGGEGNAPMYWDIGHSAWIWLGGVSRFEKVNTTAATYSQEDLKMTAAGGSQWNYGFAYGHVTDFTPGVSDIVSTKSAWKVGKQNANTDNDNTQRMVVARSRVIGGGESAGRNGGWDALNFNRTGSHIVRYVGFRNASYGNDGFFNAGTAGWVSTMDLFWRDWCSVQYAGASGTDAIFVQAGGTTDCAATDIDVDDFLIEETSGVVGTVEGTAYATITSGATGFCDDAPVTEGCNGGSGAWTQCSLTDVTSDPFGNGAGSGLCSSAQCAAACGHDLTENLNATQTGLYIPAHLVDGLHEVEVVHLEGNGKNIGP